MEEAEIAYSSGALESIPGFLGVIHVVHLFLVFIAVCVVSVLFLSCPCCSPEYVGHCRFPFALNIPLVFLYFSYEPTDRHMDALPYPPH